MSTSPTITSDVRQWRRYLPCRETGISWLGEVPSHWQVKRLKHICHMNPSKSEIKGFADDLPVSFLPMEKVSEDGGLDLEWSRPLGVVWQGFTYFRDGDVLVAKITPCFENGKGALARGLSNGIGFGTTELHVLRAKPIIDPQFLELVTRQYSFRRLGCMSMTGVAGQQRVSEAFISNFIAAIPPLDEQRRIVAFIDRETAKIDALIAKKERLIELLQEKRTALVSHAVTKGIDPSVPMKDSGVEWAGKVPAHWNVTRAKFLFRQSCLPVVGGEGVVTAFRDGQVTLRENRRTEGFTFAILEVGYQGVRKGQLVLHSMDAFAGAIGVSESDGKCTPEYIVCDPTSVNIIPEFYAPCLREMSRQKFIEVSCQAVRERAPRIRFSTFGEMWLPVPPREEQQAIAAHVILSRRRYDECIRTVQKSISVYQEYRTALISAAVTGKIDVSSELAAVVEPKITPEKPAAKPANPYFRRSVFAAEIIDQLCNEPTFGHVKFQKCLFVAQHHLRVEDFEESYKRMAAGPYDNRLVRSVDSQLEKGRWFKAEKVGDRYTYRRLDKAGGHRQYFERYFGKHAKQLGKLLDLFRPLDTDRAEIIATLYAVWNDFLLRGEPCDDDRIVAEVLTNWHDRKKRFDEARWRRALDWMREKGLVPTGFGKPTVAGEVGS